MYLPALFRDENPALCAELVARFPLATVVTVEQGVPTANHLPLVYDPAAGARGALRGHMARANPQWRGFDGARPMLAVFQGPQAYVTPAWYGPGEHVPTWNYAVVHVHGAARVVDDPARALAMMRELVAVHEAPRREPWRLDLAPDTLADLMAAIVCFELVVDRVEVKLKLSQNRAPEDRERVTAALCASEQPRDREVGALMQALRRGAES